MNTALADGDALYAGNGANLELQVGPRAFVRAGENTQIGLEDQQPDFLQLKVTGGHAAIDVRELTPGQTIELDTPNAAFTIDRAGYYRIDVADNSTTFITRRGGEAAATPSGGALTAVATNQEAIIQGTDTPQVATDQAPDLDAWDQWNYQRGDSTVVAGDSGDPAPASMYGSEQLNQYGTWRDTEPYGRVWVPSDVDPTWAPYSTGQWMWDPYYSWTWVDDAPWGWAPYHYGRWVHFDSYWGWAPGPIYAAPVYEPALVAFFGFPGFHVGIGFGTPIGWVALGWGEPLLPWWGGVGFIGWPCWNGWFGPRIVNNVFVNNTTIVNVNNINFVNTRVPHALVAVAHDRFGNGAVERARIANIFNSANSQHLQPVRGALPVNAGPHSLVAGGTRGVRPPQSMMSRSVVATRAPHSPTVHDSAAARLAAAVNPQPRLAPAAQQRVAAGLGKRAPDQQAAPSQPGNIQRLRGAPGRGGPTGVATRFAPPPPPHSGTVAHGSPSTRGTLARGGQVPAPGARAALGSIPSRPASSNGPVSRMNSRWSPPPPPRQTGTRNGQAPGLSARSAPGADSNRAIASNRPASRMTSRWTPPPPPQARRGARGGYAFASNPPTRPSTSPRGMQPAPARVPQHVASVPPPPPVSRSFASPRAPATSGASPRQAMPPAMAAPHMTQPRIAQPQAAPPRMMQPQVAPPARVAPPQVASSRGAPPRMSAPRFQAARPAAPRSGFRAPAAAPSRQNSGGRTQAFPRGPGGR